MNFLFKYWLFTSNREHWLCKVDRSLSFPIHLSRKQYLLTIKESDDLISSNVLIIEDLYGGNGNHGIWKKILPYLTSSTDVVKSFTRFVIPRISQRYARLHPLPLGILSAELRLFQNIRANVHHHKYVDTIPHRNICTYYRTGRTSSVQYSIYGVGSTIYLVERSGWIWKCTSAYMLIFTYALESVKQQRTLVINLRIYEHP